MEGLARASRDRATPRRAPRRASTTGAEQRCFRSLVRLTIRVFINDNHPTPAALLARFFARLSLNPAALCIRTSQLVHIHSLKVVSHRMRHGTARRSPVDPDIIVLRAFIKKDKKKTKETKEINASKMYSQVGMFVERAK